ncbi:MAG: hypothetical protein LBU32_27760, partial [Clostridiales bacterium]|nr:hypothetical protein [Clostridiales bacterium]
LAGKALQLELRLDRPAFALNPPAHECGSLKAFIPMRRCYLLSIDVGVYQLISLYAPEAESSASELPTALTTK